MSREWWYMIGLIILMGGLKLAESHPFLGAITTLIGATEMMIAGEMDRAEKGKVGPA